jgi:phosphoribosylformylglycinamidine synthase
VSVAVGELADGLVINLDAVTKKYEGLDGTELAISESQERMAVVVAKEEAERFKALAQSENLEANIIAEVTQEPRLVMLWRGVKIVDISREFLDSNGAEKHISLRSAPSRFDKKAEASLKRLIYACGRLNVVFKTGAVGALRLHHRGGYGAHAAGRKVSENADTGDGYKISWSRRY